MQLDKTDAKIQVFVLNQFMLVGMSDSQVREITENNEHFIATKLLCSLHTTFDDDNQPTGYRIIPEPIPMDLMANDVSVMHNCINYVNRVGILCYSEVTLDTEESLKIEVVKQFMDFWGLSV